MPESRSGPAQRRNGGALQRRLRPVRKLFRALERVAPPVVGPLAIELFRRSRRHPAPAREQGWLAAAEPLRLEVDGHRVAAWSWGGGPTVLLVHGWEGRAGQMGALALALARAGYRAVAFDAPGHGASQGRLSSLPQFAAAVSATADRLGPLRAVVGHSFGAAGTGWALHRGLPVERLVFVAAPWDLQRYVDFFGELVGLSERGLERMIARFGKRFDAPWPEARFATSVAADDRPLLVIHDRDDPEIPISAARQLAAAWPAARLLETSGLGHNRILREQAVVEEVVGFIGARPD
jgi:pimeloyl-ACP methyl ester carboxylesterase